MKRYSEIELRKEVDKRWGAKLSDSDWGRYGPKWPLHEPYGNAELNEIMHKLQARKVKPRPPRRPSKSEVRSELITPLVQELTARLRKDLFGSERPPFKNCGKMTEWLRAEAQRQAGKVGTDGLDPNLEAAILHFPIGEYVELIEALPGTKLWKIWNLARIVASDLDCRDVQATMYVLVGIIPFVAPITVTMPRTYATARPVTGKLIITIREPVSEAELIRIYRECRRQLWSKQRGPKPFEERDAALVRFVIPKVRKEGHITKELMAAWNEQYPQWPFDESRAFRTAVERAHKKIYPQVSEP
jgi:hypothetical protein